MIASMTAFARLSDQQKWGIITWELRSVNHRFLEVTFRLPDFMRELETAARSQLSSKISRGKCEAFLRFTPPVNSNEGLVINKHLLAQLSTTGKEVLKYFPDATTDLLALLNWPGVIENQCTDNEQIRTAALELLGKTIDDLIEVRQREGKQIKDFLLQRLAAISQHVEQIAGDLPKLLDLERERISMRLQEWREAFDQQRLEQEMALLIQKTDIAEEIQRLHGHCQAMRDTLDHSGAMGRRLDFLSQELHREANTLGNKALTFSLVQASLEMKVLIEQIREQVQNIE
ncbi:MAG: YicC family protein [Proteobacteria bacterium]|nr:YicC family protein [Pseudomonadota bacterium]